MYIIEIMLLNNSMKVLCSQLIEELIENLNCLGPRHFTKLSKCPYCRPRILIRFYEISTTF